LRNVLASGRQQGIDNGFDYFLNGFRAFAVVIVVLFHFGLPGLFRGFLGVDIFFVLSGFVMMAIAERYIINGRISVGRFFRARLLRLYPALAVTVTVTLICSVFILFPEDLARTGFHGILSTGFVSNFGFWREAGYFDAAKDFKPLLHTWSLSVEWQFYLFWPFALFLLVWHERRTIVLLVIVAVLSLSLSLIFASHPNFVFYLMPMRAWEFLAGVGACRLFAKYGAKLEENLRYRSWLGALSFVMLAIGVFVPFTLSPLSLWGAKVFAVAGTAGLLISRPLPLLGLVRFRPIKWLGEISYSLYLWHWPLYILVLNLVETEPNGFMISGLFLGSLILAQLSYLFVEVPVRSGRRILSTRFFVPAALAVPLGFSVWVSEGWTWRYPETAQATMAFFNAERESYRQSYGRMFPMNNEADWKRTRDGGLGCLLDKIERQGSGLEVAADCVVGNLSHSGERKRYLLVGDSNGKNVFEALQIAFPQYHFAFLMYSGCAPAEYQGCFSGLRWLLEQIAARSSPDGVILASRFANQPWYETDSTLQLSKDYNWPVLMVGATPTLKRQLAFAMIRTGQTIGGGQITLPFDPVWFHMDSLEADKYLEHRASIHHDWFFVSKRDAFCINETCRFSDSEGERPWYSDDQHLTLEGVARLAEWLGEREAVQTYFGMHLGRGPADEDLK
jgi:peptidoglycan/LPS O-acetylase OafA/YrhL